jgi:uncharacterized protein
MKRDILPRLREWRSHPYRKPLILRGARQVGKSWIVEEFSKEFPLFVVINFEKIPQIHEIFVQDLTPTVLLEKLALYAHQKIIPGQTLLFFDEIQECLNAIRALRYLKEEVPDLHVIAAGSLIDFALEKIGVPVGRIQFMYLFPLSFGEFLSVNNRDDLREYIKTQRIDPIIHNSILEYLKNYCWLGGMPAVVNAWIKHGDPQFCHEIQDEILDSYQQDFNRYAESKQIIYLNKIFTAIPKQLGNKFKFSQVDADMHSLPLKEALTLLNKAGIAYYCYHTSAHSPPLGAEIKEKKFKIFFFDIGLAQRLLGLDTRDWLLTPVKVANIGPITEQLVAQEFLAYHDVKKKLALYYWHREARGSNAEVDFIIQKDSNIIPVEVKSAKDGRMRSLHLYLESHPESPYGLKIAEHLFSQQSRIQEIPLYGIESWITKSD